MSKLTRWMCVTPTGARIIFAALDDLANRKEPVAGVVGDVYLFGAPVTADSDRWQAIRYARSAHNASHA